MDLLKIYKNFTIEGNDITIGEYGFGYIHAYHNDVLIASANVPDYINGIDDKYVLMNININEPYETKELTRLMFEAAEFYYGDFLIEENFRPLLAELIKIESKVFKHLPFATTTDEPVKC